MLKPLVLGAEAGRRAMGLAAKVPGADLAAARAVVASGRLVPTTTESALTPGRARLRTLHEQAATVLFEANPTGSAKLLESLDLEAIDDAGYLERLAQRFLKVKEYEAALQMRLRAKDLEPQNPVRWVALARSYQRAAKGGTVRDSVSGLVEGPVADGEKAREALQRAAELAPEDPGISYQLGRFEFDHGHVEAGLDRLQEVTEKHPAYRWLLDYAHRARRPHVLQMERAQRAYEQALALRPTSSVALRGILATGTRAAQDWAGMWESALVFEASKKRGYARRRELLDQLTPLVTAPHVSAEQAEAILALLQDAEDRGIRLRWATVSLISYRLQFAGQLRAGFALRRSLAERTLRWLGDSSGGHAGHRQKLLAALSYLGRTQEALELIDPLPWQPSTERGRLRLEKLRADTRLLHGDVQPYLDYSAQVRKATPLPGEEKMAELISGKRVAVVGPAETSDELGELIDSYDVVIRTRFQAGFVAENARRIGSRTDITYYAGRDQGLLAAEGAVAAESGDLQMVVARPLSMDSVRSLLGGETPEWLRVGRHDFAVCFHGAPLGVPRIIYDVLQFDPAEIGLFHADFYAGEQAYSQGYWEAQHVGFGPHSKMNDVITAHDLDSDFQLMQAFAATGRLTAHGASAEVMALEKDEYLRRVEAAPIFPRPAAEQEKA